MAQIPTEINVRLVLLERPASRWHRFWQRVLLGIDWRDEERNHADRVERVVRQTVSVN